MINFQSLSRHCVAGSGDKRKRTWREGWGKRLFQIFLSKGGDYSREAISRGTAISKEIRYVRAVTPELLDMSASSNRLQNSRIFAYSSTQEQSNKRSGMRLKTESETGERR